MVTPPKNACANFNGGTGNVGPINFKPPLALNDGPAPLVSPARMRAYGNALAPFAELGFGKNGTLTSRTFDFDFDWSWKAAGNQLGNPAIPAIGQYWSNRLTITSHVNVSVGSS